MTESKIPVGPEPLSFLNNPTFAAPDQLMYQLADPTARDMNTTVVYAGAHPQARSRLTAEAYGGVIGTALGGNYNDTRFVANVALSVILPNEQQRDYVGVQVPGIENLRRELGSKFASHSLAGYLQLRPQIRKVVVGAGSAGTIKDIDDQLQERTTLPWTETQRHILSIILNEPDFNAVVMLKTLGHKYEFARFYEDDNSTRLSVPKFIELLNQLTTTPPHHTVGDLYNVHYQSIKNEFVRHVLNWLNDGGSARRIFGPLHEAKIK